MLNCGAGSTDWRLPNRNELVSLVHNDYYGPAVPNTAGTGQWSACDPFNNVNYRYWSSTTYAYDIAIAYSVNFYDGAVSDTFYKNVLFRLWPVRGGQ